MIERSSERPARVFISYSHDSDDHRRRVLEFAQQLREDGVDATLDQFVIGGPPEGWPRWMQRQIEQSDYVALVCTDQYRRRFEGLEELGRGLGANWEGLVLKQMLYEASAVNRKFIPVLLQGASSDTIPLPLRAYTFYSLPDDYELLLRTLTGQPSVLPAPLGVRRVLPPQDTSRTQPTPVQDRVARQITIKLLVQEVFVTRGVPKHTLVETETFERLAGELLKPRLGLVVEGPSGIGKTVAVKRALEDPRIKTQKWSHRWIPVRAPGSVAEIEQVLSTPASQLRGHLVVDDFHRLPNGHKRQFADFLKVLADDDFAEAKITLIGVPRTRQSLVNEVPDLAYGALVVKMPVAKDEEISTLIAHGEVALNVLFTQRDELIGLAQGSFAVAQYLCEQALDLAKVRDTQSNLTDISLRSGQLIARSLELMYPQFHPQLQAFAMLDRDAAPRGAALTLLQSLGQSDDGAITIADIKARFPEFQSAFVSLTNRLKLGGEDADWPAAWWEILYCNHATGVLALEDPKLHFYLRRLDWPTFWEDCGVFLSTEIGPAIQQVEAPPISSSKAPRSPKATAIGSGGNDRVLRVLHLSDLHFNARSGWDSDAVLSRLVDDIRAFGQKAAPADVVVISGDVAKSGTKDEYDLASRWITGALLPATALTETDLFVVPGNHDFDRRRYRGVTKLALEALTRSGSQSDVAAALQEGPASPVLAGHHDYVNFLNQLGIAGNEWTYPWSGVRREIANIDTHIACLSSAWLASGDDDYGKLALGLWQVSQVFAGCDGAELVVAAIHHPFDWMAEWDTASRVEVMRNADVVLRGHLHDAASVDIRSAGQGRYIELAAGASYEHSQMVQGYQWVEFCLDRGIVAISPRTWNSRQRDWAADLNRYQCERLELPLPRGRLMT